MNKLFKLIIIIITTFANIAFTQLIAQDSLINNKKWQVGFNISNFRVYDDSKPFYDEYFMLSTPRGYYQWDLSIKRSFIINNKLNANIGFSFRYMPFEFHNHFDKDSVCNITLKHNNSQFALDFPIMIKYHLFRLATKNDFYVYGGIKLSLYNYNKQTIIKESSFYDPDIDQIVTYNVSNEYFNKYGSDKNGYKVLLDANIAAGVEYQYNSKIALSFEYTYLPREILIVESKSNFDATEGYINKTQNTYRSHFYWSIGASYLF